MRPRLIVSMVGTSVLTNGAPPEVRSAALAAANARTKEEVEDTILEPWIQCRVEDIAAIDTYEKAKRASAELNALVRLRHSDRKPGMDYHALVHTDTWLGQKAAELISTWLSSEGETSEPYRVPNLRTDSLESFRVGIAELIRWCEDRTEPYRRNGNEVIFNLTGGFKSIQGVMQSLSMFYADRAVYVFESGEALLELPTLPVRLDFQQFVLDSLPVFRRLAAGLPVDAAACAEIPDSLLLTIDGEVTLSQWGELAWQRTRNAAYREALLPSPSKALVFSDAFHKSVSGLPGDRKILINERMDDLARFLETGTNLKRLSFKSVEGNPVPGSTHELYAWSDKDAQRIFGHYENGTLVLDALDKHL